MKFATFVYGGREIVGVVQGDFVYPVENIVEDAPKTMLDLIDNFSDEDLKKFDAELGNFNSISLKNVKLVAPIPQPRRGVICLGKNYIEHVNEVDTAGIDQKLGLPKAPIYFCKLVNRAVGHMEEMDSNEKVTSELDYEVELGIIIGKEGKDIPIDKVEEHIFGYTIINDVSAREVQKRHTQWFRGKSLDGTCPMGPYIVTKEEIDFPPKLGIEAYVNGEKRQCGNTSDMIFSIPHIISEFSKGLTLKKGDIISTGTPSGVGMGFNPPKFLKKGDVVECCIEGIGTLKNIVK